MKIRTFTLFALFSFSIFSLSDLFSQARINQITKLGNRFCIFTESNWYKDALLVAGTSAYFNEGWKATLIKYDNKGSILETFYLPDTIETSGYSFWDKGLIIDQDTIIHTASVGFVDPDQLEGMVFKLNMNNEFITSKIYKSAYFPTEQFCRFKDFIKLQNGFAVLSSEWRNFDDAQCGILRLDENFNKIWRYNYGQNISKEFPSQIFQLTNGHFVVLANSTNLDISDEFYGMSRGYYRSYIFEVDEEGNLVWEWKSPDRSEAGYAGHLINDSTLVVAAGNGTVVCFDPGDPNSQCHFEWTGEAYKFNLNTREKIWETSMSGGQQNTMFDNSYRDIIPSIENDGFILCGEAYYGSYEGCAQVDTTVKCWNFPGIIAKVSNNGDSIWMRKYFGVTDVWESNQLHDAEITPDSGYSFVGEAFNPWQGDDQGQFGWLLMTDKYGCLVPGCQLVSSTNEPVQNNSETDISFKIYPNPAVSIVNVLITQSLLPDAVLHLIDESGNELDQWRNFEKGATYMIPVDNYPAGIYFLNMTYGNSIVGNEKLIISHQ